MNDYSRRDMTDDVCVVTGANSGIGKETAAELAREGACVLMVCRDEERGARAAEEIGREASAAPRLFLADFGSFEQVRDVAGELAAETDRIDVLVNNAGLITPTRTITEDGNELTFQVNHLSHFLLTNLLLDELEAAPRGRVVTVSSSVHFRAWSGIRFDDLTFAKGYDGFAAYAHSKLANVMFSYELARRAEESGVASNVLNPGLVGTNFGSNEPGVVRTFYALTRPFIPNAEKGARTVVYAATATELDDVTGEYLQDQRRSRSSPVSYDRGQWNELWEKSAAITGTD